MTALDWAEENDHLDIADLLSRAMHSTVTPFAAAEAADTTVNTTADATADTTAQTKAETTAETATETAPSKLESAFDEANPIDEVRILLHVFD